MINFLNLEYFLVAAEELNFTRAAKRLYISQQSLSNHISNLEKEFDIALFHLHPRQLCKLPCYFLYLHQQLHPTYAVIHIYIIQLLFLQMLTVFV